MTSARASIQQERFRPSGRNSLTYMKIYPVIRDWKSRLFKLKHNSQYSMQNICSMSMYYPLTTKTRGRRSFGAGHHDVIPCIKCSKDISTQGVKLFFDLNLNTSFVSWYSLLFKPKTIVSTACKIFAMYNVQFFII